MYHRQPRVAFTGELIEGQETGKVDHEDLCPGHAIFVIMFWVYTRVLVIYWYNFRNSGTVINDKHI